MEKYRKKELQQAIAEIENIYPKDDCILSYADFLKVRDSMAFYQFNPMLFKNLVHLANELWYSEKRISRLSLLQKIKQYYRNTRRQPNRGFYWQNTTPDFQFSLELRMQLFNLFRKTFEEINYISENQLDIARKICNNLLINIELSPSEEEWLCAHASVSELILNRVLRYPIKSNVITQWAKNNYKNNAFRNRRAELVSWIMDQDSHFDIDLQTLTDDFEYLNQCDIQAIQDYDEEMEAIQLIEEELSDHLPKIRHYDLFEDSFWEETVKLSTPELKLFQRHYPIPIDSSQEYPVSIPDFKKLKEEFYNDLPLHKKLTMIWATTYSRLDNSLKCSLLKQQYSKDTYYSLLMACKKTKNIALLQWILDQQ